MKQKILLSTLILLGLSISKTENLNAQFNPTILGGNWVGRTDANITSIGIGNFTTSPLAALHINSNLLSPSTAFGAGNLFRTDGLSTNLNQWQLFTDNEKFRLSVPSSSSNVNLSVVQNANMLFSTNNFSRALFNGGTGVNSGRFALGNNLPATFAPLDRLHLHQDALSNVYIRFTYQGLANSAGTQLGIVGTTSAGSSGDLKKQSYKLT
jgi:hypothetical protein